MKATGFLLGAAVGLTAGLLLAPQKGEDLRNDIADTADKWKKKLDNLRGAASSELDQLRDILSSEISGLSDDVRFRILTILEESEASANRVKNSIASELI